jgi:predicted aspartyl protease
MSLPELMVLDQFLCGAPEELRVWLKERKPESLQKAVQLADDYALARGGKSLNYQPPPMGTLKSIPGGDEGQQDRNKMPYPPRAPPMDDRGRTNFLGERQCFQCKRFGHLMRNCPLNQSGTASGGVPKALMAQSCTNVAWNTRGHKYLRRGTLDGRPVQILIDTGGDLTMVSARLVDPSRLNMQYKVPVLCTHGDTMLYPTATVQLQMEDWRSESQVVVAPNLPVDVLLGRDLYDLQVPSTREDSTQRGKERETPIEAGMDQPAPAAEDRQELRGKEGDAPTNVEAKSLGTETREGQRVAGWCQTCKDCRRSYMYNRWPPCWEPDPWSNRQSTRSPVRRQQKSTPNVGLALLLQVHPTNGKICPKRRRTMESSSC